MPEPRSEYSLRSKDVAHILDCSPDDVIELARRSKLHAIKTGRFWRFHIKDVRAYAREKEREEEEYLKKVNNKRGYY